MHEMARLREAIIVWAAGREGAERAGEVVRELVSVARTVVLVEGVSDWKRYTKKLEAEASGRQQAIITNKY